MSCTMWLGQGPSERTKVKAKTASNWNFCVVIAIAMISTGLIIAEMQSGGYDRSHDDNQQKKRKTKRCEG